MMTDDEYREYLTALAKKHLRLYKVRFGPEESRERLNYEIHRISRVAQFLRVVSERSRNPTLIKECGQELKNVYVEHIVEEMEEAGVLSALDEDPISIFTNLRRSAIPDHEIDLLRRAGVDEPDAEITILIQRCRRGEISRRQSLPSDIVRQAQTELKNAADKLQTQPEMIAKEPEVKKRKLFGGIGKILAGVITGAGDLLVGIGTIAAPNPATAYGLIGSSALAVASISQGIGDLRGE